ncbi:MAG: acyltransferase family protein [Tannerella sp.]|jgi:fucose 4-O-acetylase-like acetyltransferase|nr:acyltransferase family protein [Tannerella sp.]
MEKKRSEWVDFTRGIAIFLVVFGHVNLGCFFCPAFESAHDFLYTQHLILYSFHMPLFFMISGFIYGYKKTNYNLCELKKALTGKLIALGIPYFIFSITLYLFKYLIGGDDYLLSWQDLFFQIKPVEYYWFLYILFLIFCIVEVLDYVFKNDFTVFVILLVITVSGWNFTTGVFLFDEVSNRIIFFYLAKLLARRPELLRNNILIISCIIAFLVLCHTGAYNETSASLNFIMAISISFPIMAVCSRIKTGSRFFQYFSTAGKRTMPIYLLHGPIATIVRMSLLHIGIDSLPVHFITGMAVAWFLPVYTWKLASRWKYSDFLFYPLKYLKPK